MLMPAPVQVAQTTNSLQRLSTTRHLEDTGCLLKNAANFPLSSWSRPAPGVDVGEEDHVCNKR